MELNFAQAVALTDTNYLKIPVLFTGILLNMKMGKT